MYEHTTWVTVACSPDGRLIASGSDDGMIIIWNFAGENVKTCFKHDDKITQLVFTADSLSVISRSMDHTIYFWSTTK
ncbi:quinon protein alcohol dehydrogenase-like superfamily, partial [Lentinula raphanica]